MNLFKRYFPPVLRTIAGSLLMLSLVLGQGCSEGGDGEGNSKGASFSIGENANMPSGGTITAQYSDSPTGADISKIIDNDRSTSFVTPHSSFHIIWEGETSEAVSSYSLTSGDSEESDPVSWRLSGSRDSKNWILIDARSDQRFDGRQTTAYFQVDNETRYKYYKLEILANNGNSATHIAEWSIMVPDMELDISDLIAAYGYGSTHSLETPMGTKYEQRHRTTDEDREWLLDPSNEPTALTAKMMSDGCSWQAVGVNLYPFGKPMPADCNQHGFNDCGAVAALASMAYMNPEFVRSLIKDNGDNTYTVSMFDPQGQPIEVAVTNKFIANSSLALICCTGKNGTATWSTVLEKAIIKYNMIYKVNTNPDIGGIGQEHVPPLFTGNGDSFAVRPGVMSNQEMERIVYASLRQGKFVFGGFNKKDIPVGNAKTVTMHVYSMMHSANDAALFSMRNPWGGSQVADGKDDGILDIPNNLEIPKLIDFRIVEPGLSGTGGVTEPYLPPVLN